jgi:AbrB family looped-hinge helix DNA binding protein
MEVIKLGKKGQLSLPAGILRKLGIQGAATLLVEATDDGAVMLRPGAVYPVEMYSESRLKAFEAANAHTATEKTRVRKALAHSKK